MSGGSFDYFYSRVDERLATMSYTLTSMAEICQRRAIRGIVGEDYYDFSCKGWRKPTEEEIGMLAKAGETLAALSCEVEVLRKKLEPLTEVMRAVEWWSSGDTHYDHVIDAMKEATVKMQEADRLVDLIGRAAAGLI